MYIPPRTDLTRPDCLTWEGPESEFAEFAYNTGRLRVRRIAIKLRWDLKTGLVTVERFKKFNGSPDLDKIETAYREALVGIERILATTEKKSPGKLTPATH